MAAPRPDVVAAGLEDPWGVGYLDRIELKNDKVIAEHKLLSELGDESNGRLIRLSPD